MISCHCFSKIFHEFNIFRIRYIDESSLRKLDHVVTHCEVPNSGTITNQCHNKDALFANLQNTLSHNTLASYLTESNIQKEHVSL